MESIKEKAEEYADRENPTCPCEECLIKTFKAGANYVLDAIEKVINDDRLLCNAPSSIIMRLEVVIYTIKRLKSNQE